MPHSASRRSSHRKRFFSAFSLRKLDSVAIWVIKHWNSVQQTKLIKQLRVEGFHFEQQDFQRVSPYAHEHVLPYGQYRDVFVEVYTPCNCYQDSCVTPCLPNSLNFGTYPVSSPPQALAHLRFRLWSRRCCALGSVYLLTAWRTVPLSFSTAPFTRSPALATSCLALP